MNDKNNYDDRTITDDHNLLELEKDELFGESEMIDNATDFITSDDDFYWGDSSEWEDNFEGEVNHNPTVDNVYTLEGYGNIYELSNYLSTSNGVIELLQHSNNNEQFNYILGMAKEESHDINLLNYLVSINYSVEDYVSINVGYQIYKYEKLIEYLLNKADKEQGQAILKKIGIVNENIANIVSARDDKSEIIEKNYHLQKAPLVTKRIIQYYKENPNKIDFEIIQNCYLNTEFINEFISLGYEISDTSPYSLLQNNTIMKREFLKTVKIEDEEMFSKLDKEINLIPGSYNRLCQSKNKEIFSKKFLDKFGKSATEQMIKYIVLGEYQIDLTKIDDDNIGCIKDVYDSFNKSDLFDVQLFAKIIFKFNMNPGIFENFDIHNIDKEKLKIYFQFKELMISDIGQLNNIEKVLYNYVNNKIQSCNNQIDLKNIICNLLTNQTYFETKKGLLELTNTDKLSVLKNSVKNKIAAKKLDSYIILSDFIETMDNIESVDALKSIASLLNQEILENGLNNNWIDFDRKILNFYTLEFNERMTNFKDHLTEQFYDTTNFTFKDGKNVNNKRVMVSHIKNNEEFNSMIHVLNAYEKGITGSIESVAKPKFIGNSYISLTGISDEYSRMCFNNESKFSIKILYSHIPIGDMFCASNRDTGISTNANSKNIYTRLSSNMAPFRRIVRNTEIHGSEAYNEIDIFRDNLTPSGIAFMSDRPTEEEINAAAYLDVPLVKIDALQESFRKDYFSNSQEYDESFYSIKDHEYENNKVTVIPNDKYDVIVDSIRESIIETLDIEEGLEVFSEKREFESDAYFVVYNNEKYSAKPVYEYIDSNRKNVRPDFYEESLIKDKLYNILDIEPRTKFIKCKYLNGNNILSVINNTNEKRTIDKYIDFLVEGVSISNDLSSYNSIEDIKLLSRINCLNDAQYLSLFEPLIKTNDFIEPNIMTNEIIQRREQIKLFSVHSEVLNQTYETSFSSQENANINSEDKKI